MMADRHYISEGHCVVPEIIQLKKSGLERDLHVQYLSKMNPVGMLFHDGLNNVAHQNQAGVPAFPLWLMLRGGKTNNHTRSRRV